MFRFLRKSKPVKIRTYNESRKYGVAAKDVQELLKKGCKLLQVSPYGFVINTASAFSPATPVEEKSSVH